MPFGRGGGFISCNGERWCSVLGRQCSCILKYNINLSYVVLTSPCYSPNFVSKNTIIISFKSQQDQ